MFGELRDLGVKGDGAEGVKGALIHLGHFCLGVLSEIFCVSSPSMQMQL